MPIRPARLSDLDAITQVLTTAFWDEDAVGRNMHPHRNEYPQDVSQFWRASIWRSWWDWDHVLLVATIDDGKVVGAANWTRMGGWGGLRWWDPREFPSWFHCSSYSARPALRVWFETGATLSERSQPLAYQIFIVGGSEKMACCVFSVCDESEKKKRLIAGP